MQAAFFDLDGTLFDGHIWQGIRQHHRRYHTNLVRLYVYLATHLVLYPLYKAGLLGQERFYAMWARDMAWLLAGFSEEQMQRTFERMAGEYILPLARSDVVEILRDHQAQGHEIVLVSGSWEGLVEVMSQRLGLPPNVIGTQVEVANGRCTGRIIEPLCMGRGKVRRLREFVEARGDIDLAASYAYADSFTDVPFLEIVGHPVTVYPDPQLAATAVQRGWPIMGTAQ